MIDMTLIRPLNEAQGHSFLYQSISHIRLPIGSQVSIVTFALERTVYIRHRETDNRRTQACSISATV